MPFFAGNANAPPMLLRPRHSPRDHPFGPVTLACRDPSSRFPRHGPGAQRNRRHLRQRAVDRRSEKEERLRAKRCVPSLHRRPAETPEPTAKPKPAERKAKSKKQTSPTPKPSATPAARKSPTPEPDESPASESKAKPATKESSEEDDTPKPEPDKSPTPTEAEIWNKEIKRGGRGGKSKAKADQES